MLAGPSSGAGSSSDAAPVCQFTSTWPFGPRVMLPKFPPTEPGTSAGTASNGSTLPSPVTREPIASIIPEVWSEYEIQTLPTGTLAVLPGPGPVAIDG